TGRSASRGSTASGRSRGSASTTARPSTATATTTAARSTSRRGLPRAPREARCWSPARSSSTRGRTSSSTSSARCGSRASRSRPSCSSRACAMSDLLERVRATGLLASGRPVVVLLSGGRDSVCLLDIAVALGAPAIALHVNYGLRDDAAEDEALCRALCERLGVPLTVRRPRRPEGNLQAWARDVRYAEAAALALARHADVAAGHTATDQAETVLYRLAASPGRRALLGMAARSGQARPRPPGRGCRRRGRLRPGGGRAPRGRARRPRRGRGGG